MPILLTSPSPSIGGKAGLYSSHGHEKRRCSGVGSPRASLVARCTMRRCSRLWWAILSLCCRDLLAMMTASRCLLSASCVATTGFCDASLMWNTLPPYSGAILTAVCISDVVAPPTKIGIVRWWLCISSATRHISSRLGVMSPERHTISALFLTASSTIRSGGTITPRSMTWNPLHAMTTPTMFFPMSWTSPFTVAMTTVLPGTRPMP